MDICLVRVDVCMVMIIGRLKLDFFMKYICKQIQLFSLGISDRMIEGTLQSCPLRRFSNPKVRIKRMGGQFFIS